MTELTEWLTKLYNYICYTLCLYIYTHTYNNLPSAKPQVAWHMTLLKTQDHGTMMQSHGRVHQRGEFPWWSCQGQDLNLTLPLERIGVCFLLPCHLFLLVPTYFLGLFTGYLFSSVTCLLSLTWYVCFLNWNCLCSLIDRSIVKSLG